MNDLSHKYVYLEKSYDVYFRNLKIAGVRSQHEGPYHGLAAWMSVHDLNISRDQASYANIYVGSGYNKKTNFIQTGWMVN